ncbi:MAG TPA: bifunctional demethylmenaquinone methyltransferase/2-methoxy-6-polyprenyl-1,4-benzoquinol methylase UbiE [Terrimesophilobacter sp.]|nr:bifunctional demethylmenaquinone methyltransferase/2-methoxy-6-polyprenyl-1,4-benzoquinol methylase UbiE [Terrimesophilobacter sp.]
MARARSDKQPGEVAAMFDAVAPGYDRTNTVLSAGSERLWRWQMVRALAPQPGERILDVAAGTGKSAAAIAKSGAAVVAVDFSPGMIEVGRKKHPGIEFVEGDATKLPFAAGEFDAVTISFGLRNVANPQKALKEMHRVLKPGGRIVVCEFSTPPRALFRAGYGVYLKWVMPAVAELSSSNPEAYLAESIDEWPDQATLSQWLRGAGFARVAHRNLSQGIVALHRGFKLARKRAPKKSDAAPTPRETAPKKPDSAET